MRYLSSKEVAARYGLTVEWVYGCRSLPRRKVGRYLRFLESDLEVWERRQTGSGRVYPFHIQENTKVMTKEKDIHSAPSHNSLQSGGQEFVLLFDIE